MTTLTILFSGPPEQHVKVSATPMAKLLSLLEQACAKMKPALDPSLCQLILHEGRNKRVLDLQTTYRFANIPSNAKVEILKGAAPVQAPAAPIETTTPAASCDVPHQEMQAAVPPEPQPVEEPTSETESEPDASSALPAAPASSGPSSHWQALGVDREIAVFTKNALDDAVFQAAALAGDAMDVPDNFYDVTPEDLAVLRRDVDARKKDEGMLKTRALREAAERRQAAAYGPIPVRVHFPDNVIVQAAFSALEPLAKLQALVSSLLCSDLLKPGAFYLFTTPPKQIIRDLDLTFFKAQLVPAAHIYVHAVEGKVPEGFSGPFLRPPIQALLQSVVSLTEALPGQAPLKPPEQQQQAQGMGAPAEGAQAASAMEGVEAAGGSAQGAAPAAPRYTASGSKVPKWLKMGK